MQLGRLAVAFAQQIGQHEPAFGIGIADLDAEPLAGREDVARAEGAARDAVLDRADQQPEPHRQLQLHERLGEAEGHRGAAHVLLHEQHVLRGLEIEPAGVEADAFADQGDLRRGGLAPDQLDQSRRARAGAADRVDRRVVLGEQRIALDRAELGAIARRDRARGIGELGRAEIRGGRVDQIARQPDRLGDDIGAPDPGALVEGETRLGLPMICLPVAIEPIAGERPAERCLGAIELALARFEIPGPGRQPIPKRGEIPRLRRIAQDQERRLGGAIGPGNHDRARGFRFETRTFEPRPDVPRLPGEPVVVAGAGDHPDRAGAGLISGREAAQH